MAEKDTSVIDIGKLFRKVWARRKVLLYKVWPITFVVSCIYIFSLPRYYSTSTDLAPEMGNGSEVGGLGVLASSFGINLDNIQTSDAITPFLYPNLMEDNGFVTSLFGIKVRSAEGDIDTDYYTYLRKHQEAPWWSSITRWLTNLLEREEKKGGGAKGFDPYYLSEYDHNVAEAIRGDIKININEKTGVITITTKSQDALICRTLADSVMLRLQGFITEYRTNKARIDYEYYENLTEKALKDYEDVRRKYARMADSNTRIYLTSAKMKLEDLESDMQLKYNSYTVMNTQLEAAKAKVQERTPAFTLLKGASVPIRPAGPKRLMFVLMMLVLATMVTVIVFLRKDLLKVIQVRSGI